ncbi:MAG: hypothetical protein FWE37_06520 [Spirochaetaceae bacterium]|nr:hypothetical protein [Spirochaetaceae bacterium]
MAKTKKSKLRAKKISAYDWLSLAVKAIAALGVILTAVAKILETLL